MRALFGPENVPSYPILWRSLRVTRVVFPTFVRVRGEDNYITVKRAESVENLVNIRTSPEKERISIISLYLSARFQPETETRPIFHL